MGSNRGRNKGKHRGRNRCINRCRNRCRNRCLTDVQSTDLNYKWREDQEITSHSEETWSCNRHVIVAIHQMVVLPLLPGS